MSRAMHIGDDSKTIRTTTFLCVYVCHTNAEILFPMNLHSWNGAFNENRNMKRNLI